MTFKGHAQYGISMTLDQAELYELWRALARAWAAPSTNELRRKVESLVSADTLSAWKGEYSEKENTRCGT